MKKGVFLTLMILSFTFLGVAQGTKPHIKFENTKHDFGTILQNADGTWEFKFTNTGKEPLIIQNVRSSCGCTIAKKPSKPILPGETEVIVVRYDTRRIGPFHKTITISSNADNASVVLQIQGVVKTKPKEEVPTRPINKGFTPIAN